MDTTSEKLEARVSRAEAMEALSFIEDIWEMAPDLPYTKKLRRFIEQAGEGEDARDAANEGRNS